MIASRGLPFCSATLAGVAFLSVSPQARADDLEPAIAAYRQTHEQSILDEFTALLKIPNVGDADRPMMRLNAEAIADMVRRRDLAPRLLTDPEDPTAPPLVYGEWRVPGAKRTLVYYAHYDGQPVNPVKWDTPPFNPTLRHEGAIIAHDSPQATDPETRLYARGAGDDKGGVMVILGAIDVLHALRLEPNDNLKIVFEGEEEAGSPHLGAILRANKDLLASDLWVICDGPMNAAGRPLVTYGVRGDMNADLTVYGAKRPLHSGHYGNWAPNPALRLARLLASMKDESGRVTIPGWYDGLARLGVAERSAIKQSAGDDAALLHELGLARAEGARALAESVTEPSLNINGMRSADVGAEAANVIPDTATAVLDMRLVGGEDPRRQFDKLRECIRSQGYLVLDRPPTAEERLANPLIATLTLRPGAYPAERTPMDDPLARAIGAAAQTASESGTVQLPTSGGSLPLSIISQSLGAHVVIVSIANHDDNQHAANENLRLGNLWTGIDLYASLMMHR